MPQIEKSIIKKRAMQLRMLGEELIEQIKKDLKSPRKVLVEQIIDNEVIGYDQNYMKHHIPMIGLPIGEIVTR